MLFSYGTFCLSFNLAALWRPTNALLGHETFFFFSSCPSRVIPHFA